MNTEDHDPGEAPQDTCDTRPPGGFWDLLNPAEKAALQLIGQVSAFGPGEAICVEGATATEVLVLTEGWVKILAVNRKRRNVVLALRGPGDIIGELAGRAAGRRTASVTAAGHVRALVIDRDQFTRHVHSRPEANRAYSDAITQRWQEAADMHRSRSLDNSAQRLAGFLLDLASRHGTPTETGTVITMLLSQEEIASLIGASRATVTRALRNWRGRGLITSARHQITITNSQGLHGAAGRPG